MVRFSLLPLIFLFAATTAPAQFSKIPTEPKPGDELLNQYFETETKRVANRTLAAIETKEDWENQKDAYRRQLFEMLGLQPLPARSNLKAKVNGQVEKDGIIVERVVFQSRPGLYVTGNFYRPKKQDGPLPAILYVCGHGRVKMDGVSYGNKTHYQHHGTWFAKNGYVCLTIDTLQLGEIEGIHHGTHNLDRWWWISRGYTSAGVEAWNCIRALDYLETRDEVDMEKVGVTGRSGGGAYSWWISALDERIKVSAPVAGIASMKNHVVDGCVEGHCDCMFQLNTYRWDFPMIAALVAPRPLLIVNTDDDRIFPTDGVVDVFMKTRRIYELLDAKENLGLSMYQGGHKDTQPIRVAAFHWFERHLKGKDIDHEMEHTVAPKIFDPKELKVLDSIPENERNTSIDEYFTRRIPRRAKLPESATDWKATSGLMQARLKSKSFRGWPGRPEDLDLTEDFSAVKDGMQFTKYTFRSQSPFRLPLYVVHREGVKPEDLELVVLNVLDGENWDEFLSGIGAAFPKAFPGVEEMPDLDKEQYEAEKKMHAGMKWGMAYLAPRGIGPTSWTDDEKEVRHIRRRFALLGQTLDGMRVWDARRGIQALREIDGMSEPKLWLQSSGTMAGNTLYASLFEKDVHRLDLHRLPASHREGPTYMNVLRFMDVYHAAAIAAGKSQVRIYSDDEKAWAFLTDTAKKLKWDEKQVQIRESMMGEESEKKEKSE
ncbi:MAG: prolyl oligopeptidase family serine peptidase [Verrucomicrobiales bacterium]|nr:prolyl oligopeptidase family serine peptidase [Verrucomicrobiales bacterium]